MNTSTAWIEGALSKEALTAFHAVYRDLGLGFLEAGYANALAVELRYRGLSVERQLLNYLRCSRLEVGFLFNFGPKPQLRRKIFTNDRK